MALRRIFTSSGSSGEKQTVLLPVPWAGDGTVPGVVYCHGYGEDAILPVSSPQTGQWQMIDALVNAGYPVIVCDLGGHLFGADPFATRVNAAILTLQVTYGAKTGKVFMFGTSMGGCGALSYSARNPTKVYGLAAVAPVVDLQAVVTNNEGGLAAAVNVAYGGYSDASYSAFNPARQAESGLFTMPVQLWQGTTDNTVVPARCTTLAATIGANAQINYLSGGHSETTWREVDTTSLIKFVKTCTGT